MGHLSIPTGENLVHLLFISSDRLEIFKSIQNKSYGTEDV